MQNFRLRTTERRRFYHIKQGLHSHIPFCIKNYVLTCIIITLGPQSCFGNFTAAGRDISSPAQHPSPAMPRAISSAAAKKLIPHLVNVPVTAPRVLAAKAIWCTTLSTPPTKKKKMQRRIMAPAWHGEILLPPLSENYNDGFLFVASPDKYVVPVGRTRSWRKIILHPKILFKQK